MGDKTFLGAWAGAYVAALALIGGWHGVLVGMVASAMEACLPRLAAMSPQQLVNVALCFAGALVALGASNRMNRHTECTIIISFFTTGAGLLGYGLGSLLPDRWEAPMDTVLLGGICALLVGTRRQTIWIDPAWMPRLSYAISCVTWGAFFLGVS